MFFYVKDKKNKQCFLQSCYFTSQITTTYTAVAISSTLPHHFWHNFSPLSFSNWLDFSSSNRGDSNYWAQQQTCLNHWLNKTVDESSLYIKGVKGEWQELCKRDTIRYKTSKCECLKHIFFSQQMTSIWYRRSFIAPLAEANFPQFLCIYLHMDQCFIHTTHAN